MLSLYFFLLVIFLEELRYPRYAKQESQLTLLFGVQCILV
jgi:hypothetical protein